MLDREVYEYKSLGNINIKLNDIMENRKISTYELSTKANVRFQTIKALRENTAKRIDFEVLKKLCFVLNCKVEDIIEYEKEEK